MTPLPVDHVERDRVRKDLDTSFVLEAGAGTGKTTLLVDRILALVLSGRVRLDQIAAVTFTENAATTMKLRIREGLERARAEHTGVERGRAAAALDTLERAPISTIHALATALLQERPLECGVLPGFRVADEAEADVLFAEAWSDWLNERLVFGDDVLLDALERGIPLEGEGPWGERTSLRGLARVLLDERDLLPLVAEGQVEPLAWRDELLAKAARAAELVANVQAGDLLAARLQDLVAFAESARGLEGRPLLDLLGRIPDVPKNFGHKPRWPSPEALTEARLIAEWTKKAPAEWAAARGASLHARIVAILLGVGALYERRKKDAGLLDFLDLLLKAREALRSRPSVREYFRARFRVLIIDEFQDTDRVQGEIAELLAGEVPGSLVVVGDAKQSIYRFRRAEVALFRKLAEETKDQPGRAVLRLYQNFRSKPAILRFVNRVFSDLIQESTDTDQPRYEPISPQEGLDDGPSVIALCFPAESYAMGADLLRAEALALAAFVARAAQGGYPVRDPSSGLLRPSRAGDVLILARRLTQARYLEEAFEALRLRFAVEGGKSFFDRQEVNEVLAVLRAVDDPSDRVSWVGALRSSFFGVSDRDIAAYALAGGKLGMGAIDEDKPGASTLGPAEALLERLHRMRTKVSVAALLETLYDETRVLAALTGTARGEAAVANLEKVVSLSRQAADLGFLTLRGFANLLSERIASAREEPDLPTTRPGDPEVVRILSIHRAKGLEAPIVALFDSADNARANVDTVPLWEEGRLAIGFRSGCQPPQWDVLVKREEGKARAEGRRLLYVACTRARDLLVIPKPPTDARAGDFWRELHTRLPNASDADVQVVDAESLVAEAPPRPDLWSLAGARGGDAVAAVWDEERKELIATGAHRPLTPVRATRVAERTAPAAVTVGGSAGGRSFGSLVHQMLEWTPLTGGSPDETTTMARALAPKFGLDSDAADRAAASVARVLASAVMERARQSPRVWRELPFWLPETDELVEGIVDLVFEEEGQLVVVDYKTDPVTAEQAVDQAAHHAPQLRLYGRGLTLALGVPVRERIVLFTALGEAIAV
jgi:ATP-dependent exoDNAse (exonuclease V) beta subunit